MQVSQLSARLLAGRKMARQKAQVARKSTGGRSAPPIHGKLARKTVRKSDDNRAGDSSTSGVKKNPSRYRYYTNLFFSTLCVYLYLHLNFNRKSLQTNS